MLTGRPDGLTTDPPANDAGSCRSGATCQIVSEVVRVNRSNATVLVTVPLQTPLAVGAAPCVQPSLLDFSASNDTCVAGCCEEEMCVCRDGYYGPRCEFELRCASASVA